jgi:hypothetical protein
MFGNDFDMKQIELNRDNGVKATDPVLHSSMIAIRAFKVGAYEHKSNVHSTCFP